MELKSGKMKDKQYYESLDKRSKEYKKYKKGLGDKVKDVTQSLGIKQCEGCKKRQESLNLLGHSLEYFFKKHKPNEFNEKDQKLWSDFINTDNSESISAEEQKLITRLLKDVLNMSVKPCSNCNSKVWLKYIKMINTIYEQNKE